MKKAKILKPVRIDADDCKQLMAIAKKENRTFSNVIQTIIKNALKK